MSFYYDDDMSYTCGGCPEVGTVAVTIGYDMSMEGEENFTFTFADGALTIACSKKLAAEIASAFVSAAEEA